MRYIVLNDKIFKDYFFDTNQEFIKNFEVNKINIIVGANNSGKSRFIRLLMQFNDYNIIEEQDIKDYNSNVSEYNELVVKNNFQGSLENITIHRHVLDLMKNNNLKLSENRYGYAQKHKNIISQMGLITKVPSVPKYYIPTLRTAHSLFQEKDGNIEKIESNIYLETLNKYYGLKGKNVEVFTGIHLHRSILNTRNSKKEIRKSFEDFERFLGDNFFGGKTIDIVAEFNKDESLKGINHSENISVHISGEKETRDLHQLGDGIQAIIVLMYKIFTAKPNSFFFIDEPELNLHPGMQRLFLDHIYSNADLKEKNITYIISTHSNHFLDLTIEKDDVSIYAFSPKNNEEGEKQFTIKNVNAGDNEILRHLGVNNSSVFMANCSIWVEGISDRNYIRAFLKAYTAYLAKNEKPKYRSSLKEDIDYAFFEYAGSNIDHYFFDNDEENDGDIIEEDKILNDIKALALSNRIYLLADSDNASEDSAKGKRLKKIEAAKKDNFEPHVIRNVREIENLLTNDIWEKVLIDFCNKNLVKEQKQTIQDSITKVLAKINYKDFQTKYVGEYLNKINKQLGEIDGTNVLNQSIYEKSKKSFGTFTQKRELSELVLKANFSWEVFSKNKEIVELTESIYKFITKTM